MTMFANNETPVYKHETREAWLQAAIDALRPMFETACATTDAWGIPEDVRVSVGFGYNGKQENKHILAQAWARCTSADQTPAVFISPVLSNGYQAIGALMHELCHVADDCEHGHRGRFVELGEAVGLEGKPTQMLPGVALEAELALIVDSLGAYPHAALDTAAVRTEIPVGPDGQAMPTGRVHTGPAAQRNRYHMFRCTNDGCELVGYKLRLTNFWAEKRTPICPECRTDMTSSN